MKKYVSQFIKSRNLLLVCICVVFFVNQTAYGQKSFQCQNNSDIKISLQSFSFNKLLNNYAKGGDNGMSVYELLEFSAENNFDAIDILSYFFPGYPEIPEDEVIYEIKKRAFHLGLEISGTGVRSDFANIDPNIRAESVIHVKQWIDVAVKLGVPLVRIFSGNIPKGYEGKWDEIAVYTAASIKECVNYGKERGVLIGVQNHGGFLKTAEETIKLVKMVNSDYFGVIVDTGYFLTEDPYSDMKMVMPYAFSFLLKESPIPNNTSVKIDLIKIKNILLESDFRGYVQIETLSPKNSPKKSSYDPYKVVPVFLKEVRTAIIDVCKK
ncbi:MAG: sugar phosphate isomerase/epimerase [Flavobacteriaceae bacterium]|nr:sugar phosphate isomerase/epimerase [Flavobacteriaceae bacterium]